MTDQPDPSQPSALRDRIRAGDATLARPLEHSVTTNEAHAAILGVVGFWLGKHRHPIGTVAIATYAILAPPRSDRRIGSKTITHEPWWFVGSLLLSYLLGKRLR